MPAICWTFLDTGKKLMYLSFSPYSLLSLLSLPLLPLSLSRSTSYIFTISIFLLILLSLPIPYVLSTSYFILLFIFFLYLSSSLSIAAQRDCFSSLFVKEFSVGLTTSSNWEPVTMSTQLPTIPGNCDFYLKWIYLKRQLCICRTNGSC